MLSDQLKVRLSDIERRKQPRAVPGTAIAAPQGNAPEGPERLDPWKPSAETLEPKA